MHDDENDEVADCDGCGDVETDGIDIPCGICGKLYVECSSCRTARGVNAMEGEPVMFMCSSCARAGLNITNLVPCRAERNERRDVDECDVSIDGTTDDGDLGGES